MTVKTAKFTIDQYHRMVEAGILEGLPVELLNGEIIEMPSEGTDHGDLSTETRDYLIALLGDRAQVREGHPITLLDTNSEPEPDLAIVRRRQGGYRNRHPQASDIFWLIEFADSSLTKDLEEKSRAYAASGIAEYWVVNLRQRTLVVKRNPFEGDYRSTITLESGDLSPLVFPDVTVSVDWLLRC
ncbi:Uma2 family endonuclease [Thermoleptolyngbya sp. C42_A2020_037]|uniref:Uma2 family endonuclease n=1 Tax=Thermoleptolyngbya sp. C42_A2020_037 TaxID=2747799 RepID=UPI001A0C78B1|nr:Uma2 family endonuclease [Thermoleptolyngbya sp. C42_A2020_037]MBF2083416.1 Uma2 family endonuclease [Thermoleptolyngbya sp. C42_A2020_037]